MVYIYFHTEKKNKLPSLGGRQLPKSSYMLMSRFLAKTPHFSVELNLEHPKNECRTNPYFKLEWHIVFLIQKF